MTSRLLTIIALCLVGIAGGIVLLNRNRGDDSSPRTVSVDTTGSRMPDRQSGSAPTGRPAGTDPLEPGEEKTEREELALVGRDRMTAQWLEQASAGLGQTRKHLVADLELDAGKAGEVAAIFARREKELATLLASMTSGGAEDDKDIVRKICALIRNKGLRADLVGVLSKEQLEAFDAREAKRERETVEARAYRDLAEINSVVRLTDAQKQEVLGALVAQAPEKVEQEADARAFMSLTYGPLAADMDSSYVRGLANLMNEDLTTAGPGPDIYSEEYLQRVEEQKAERIENELSILRGVLDEDQIIRYQEHLKAELPMVGSGSRPDVPVNKFTEAV